MNESSTRRLEPGGALRGRLFARLVEGGEGRTEQPDAAGERIGPWRLGACLGRGGTSTVFLADRADGQFQQQVALKLVRPSARLIDYFRRERQILAELQHPAIAGLIDGGELPDGRLWFAMEPVLGDRIDHVVRARRMSLGERVRLFDAVCAAVEYAHSRLLIHRDIKPHNILVDESGRPRLLDFGIAVSEQSPEIADDGAMTPSYASPEQLAGESVTTASDVYQLGLLLRAMVLPDGAPCSTLPKAPIPIARKELAAMIARATALRPVDRYPTVAALCADVSAFLRRRPLAAIPGRRYRIARLMERNRLAISVALVAVTALAVLAWRSTDALRQERDQATAAAAKASAANEFLTSLFAVPDPGEARSEKVTAHDILARGAERLHREAGTGSGREAGMTLALADVYIQLGEIRRATELLDGVAAASWEALPAHAPDRARLAATRGWLAYSRADYETAAREYEQALAVALEVRDTRERETELGVAHARKALLARRLGHLDEARTEAQLGVDLLMRSRGGDDPLTAKAWNGVGLVANSRDDKQAAVPAFERAREIYARHYGAGHPLTIGVTANLAESLMFLGQDARAETLLEDCVARLRPQDEIGSIQLALCLDTLSQARISLEHYAEAAAAAGEADAIYRERLGLDHNYRAFALIHLGDAKLKLGESAAGLAAFQQALDLRRRSFASDHPEVGNALQNLGGGYSRTGDPARAEPLLREALAIYIKGMPTGNVKVPRVRLTLASVLVKLDRRSEAITEISAARREFDAARDTLDKDRERLARVLAEATTSAN